MYLGGMSHFSNAWGMVCDNVRNFEVRLPPFPRCVALGRRADKGNRSYLPILLLCKLMPWRTWGFSVL